MELKDFLPLEYNGPIKIKEINNQLENYFPGWRIRYNKFIFPIEIQYDHLIRKITSLYLNITHVNYESFLKRKELKIKIDINTKQIIEIYPFVLDNINQFFNIKNVDFPEDINLDSTIPYYSIDLNNKIHDIYYDSKNFNTNIRSFLEMYENSLFFKINLNKNLRAYVYISNEINQSFDFLKFIKTSILEIPFSYIFLYYDIENFKDEKFYLKKQPQKYLIGYDPKNKSYDQLKKLLIDTSSH